MSLSLGGVTAGVVEYALDGLSLRHAAIAANIANANSVGYRPVRVGFEHHLAALGREQTTGAAGWSPRRLPAPQVAVGMPLQSPLGRNGVESEVVQLNQNVLQYQALIKGLDKYMAAVSTAISEGKR